MKQRIGLGLLLTWVAVCCLVGSSEAAQFKYENLGTLGGTDNYMGYSNYKEAGINDAGQVVGVAYTSAHTLHALVKSPGQAMQDLGALISGSSESHVRCINQTGTIAGYYADSNYTRVACLWVLSGGQYQAQPLPGSLGPSEVHGINAAGYAVGIGDSGNGWNAHVRTPAGTITDLGTISGDYWSEATGINDANTIVGNSEGPNGIVACFWSPSGGGFTAAAPLAPGMSGANAINNLGQAVGSNSLGHAALKSPEKDLQGLNDLGLDSSAFDLNDSGWVVGWSEITGRERAILWTSAGGMQDLNTLVVNLPPGVTLREAHAINNHGEIAGYTDNSVFRLTPIINKPPSSLLLLLN